MNFGNNELSFQIPTGYLRATVGGGFPSTTFREILTAIRDEARRSEHSRILIDAFALPAPPADMDRFWIGEALAQIFGGGDFKITILYPSELINKFAENTAVNRGARLLVIGDEEAALRWLIG